MSLKTPGSMKTVVRIIHNHSNLLYFSVVPRYTCTVWRIPCFSANSWRVWFTHSLSGCLGAVLSLDPRCCFFSFKAYVCPSDWGLFLCYFHRTISTHGFNFIFFSPIAKLCWWEFFLLRSSEFTGYFPSWRASASLKKQPTLLDATSGFPAK